MSHILPLISTIEEVRAAFIAEASGLSVPQTQFQPTPDSWSILQVVEHIYWAEQVGVLGMWKAAHAASLGIPLWEGENPNLGFSIEEVIANTWQVKEKVPEVAKPRMGGPIDFWLVSLTANQKILSTLGDYLEGMDVESIIYPHPISGPLNVIQRLEFLSFHMERHQTQIQTIKSHPTFPVYSSNK